MPNRKNCSSSPSLLLQRFIARSGKGQLGTPERVIEALIDDHRQKGTPNTEKGLQLFLQDRGVTSVDLSTEIDCEGFIEPLGTTYAEGFRIHLNKASSHVRKRFTLAHEVCHTFFYELVPEIKFGPHLEDEEEERLCNFGAAALLIPAQTLIRKAQKLPPCLDTLQILAEQFDVSLTTMFLRLRNLKLWKLEMSVWDRLSNGNFAMKRLYGGKRVNWKWNDDESMKKAWQRKASVFGSSFVQYLDEVGTTRFRPVHFELRHQVDGLIALWGEGLTVPVNQNPQLFKKSVRSQTKGPLDYVRRAHIKPKQS